jgi:membrane protease YdiL (CAAX protease family)
VALCSFGASLFSALVLIFVWPAGYKQLQSNPERIEEMIPALHPAWLGLLMAGICVYEEVIFRGVLLTHLRRLTRSWTIAVILAAAVFAALHIGEQPGSQEAATCVPLFAVAIVWSLSTIWSRSLVPAIIGHFLFNMVQLVYLW